MPMYLFTEELLGSKATKDDAIKMVEILQALGWEAHYGTESAFSLLNHPEIDEEFNKTWQNIFYMQNVYTNKHIIQCAKMWRQLKERKANDPENNENKSIETLQKYYGVFLSNLIISSTFGGSLTSILNTKTPDYVIDEHNIFPGARKADAYETVFIMRNLGWNIEYGISLDANLVIENAKRDEAFSHILKMYIFIHSLYKSSAISGCVTNLNNLMRSYDAPTYEEKIKYIEEKLIGLYGVTLTEFCMSSFYIEEHHKTS